MALYRRGGVWWGSFTHDGQRVQRSTGTGNHKAAQQILAAWRVSLAKGEAGIADRKPAPTLREFASRFLDHVGTVSAAKPSTVAFYAHYTGSLLRFDPLASAPLDRIDEGTIQQWITWRSRRPGRTIKPATINRGLATLRRMLRLAAEWRLIDRVPRVRLIPGEQPREAILSREQESVYLAACPQPLHDIAVLVLGTGMRLGECLALRCADVSAEHVTVRAGKSRYAKRSIPLTAAVREMLAERTRGAAPDDLVFPRAADDGQPLSRHTVDQQHQRVRAQLGLPRDLVIHSLRHTMLTRLGAAGVEAFTIQRIAGHSSVLISQRYVHPVAETITLAIQRLDAANLDAIATISATVPQLALPEPKPASAATAGASMR